MKFKNKTMKIEGILRESLFLIKKINLKKEFFIASCIREQNLFNIFFNLLIHVYIEILLYEEIVVLIKKEITRLEEKFQSKENDWEQI